MVRPIPRLQVIYLWNQGVTARTWHDATLWETTKFPEQLSTDCSRPGTYDVVLAGDSVLHMINREATADQHLVFRLRAALEAEGICIIDRSEPGYLPSQQLAEAQQAHEAVGADLVVLLVWKPSGDWTRVGDRLFAFDGTKITDAGIPALPFDVPTGLHRQLFGASSLVEYATLALATPDPLRHPDPERDYRAAIAWAQQAGVDLVLVEAARLDRPFSQTLSERRADAPPDQAWLAWAIGLEQYAISTGHPYIRLAGALVERDFRELRLDDCCHFNAAGHAAIADVLAPVIRERRRAQGQGQAAAPPPPSTP